MYLYNTGTRDQWRKLNGTAINQDGYRSGQYLAVPVNLGGAGGTGGAGHFPDRIPSMHSFMVLAESGTSGNLIIDYNKLIKNTTVALGDGSTQIVTRSANTTAATSTTPEAKRASSVSSIPSLVMDVIGEESADRVWIFAKEGTTHNFDNGWDGRKMTESDIAQLYVVGADESLLQVATVPAIDNVSLGFEADSDGEYTLEFSLSQQMNSIEVYLHDKANGASMRVRNGDSYTFEAKKGDASTRFSLTTTGDLRAMGDEALIDVEPTSDGKILIRNGSGNSCSAFISNLQGTIVQRVEVGANSEIEIESVTSGIYVVRLQNAEVNDARKIRVE